MKEMNTTTLSQQFINASYLKILQHSPTQIHNILNTFPITTRYLYQIEQNIIDQDIQR